MQTIVYTTVDKRDWPPGPWKTEPDKVQWQDEETGLPCLAKRQPRSGHWCGYVGVPEGHPAFKQDYDEVRVPDANGDLDWPEVHGGLTYADLCDDGPEESSICHLTEPGEPDRVWWVGFDCAHAGDLSHFSRPDYHRFGDEIYRDLGYVQAECRSLARQLAAAA